MPATGYFIAQSVLLIKAMRLLSGDQEGVLIEPLSAIDICQYLRNAFPIDGQEAEIDIFVRWMAESRRASPGAGMK